MGHRFLILGAHPDDCDLLFGGSAILHGKAGNSVKFVSFTNGNAGHQSMTSDALAARRKRETAEAAAKAGLFEYQVLDHNDGWLTPSLENRAELIRIIRKFNPDLVLCHRTCDYHPDHRAVGQLMEDASAMVGVPLCVPDAPIPEGCSPLFGYVCDDFTEPTPFTPEAAVIIDEAADEKAGMLACQTSQFFEWLPYSRGMRDFDAAKMTAAEKLDHIRRGWLSRDKARADRYREFLSTYYGDAGRHAQYAEFFALMPVRGGKASAQLRELLALPCVR
ncbi:MAG: PIG-L family deacetylase [Victivallaceae bacterium]|nr:PIG-L family deacetylase [Victivallaceae bacterium]